MPRADVPRRAGRLLRATFAAACALVGGVPAAHADDPAASADLVLRLGTLHVGDGDVVNDALVVIDDGRVVAVQAGGTVPEGVRVRTFARAVACPGFVDAVTQYGLDDGAAERPDTLTPDVRAADAFDVRAPELRAALDAGTTTLGLVPAPWNVACGRAATAGLRTDGSAEVLERVGVPVFAFRAPALRRDRVPATAAGARLVLEAAFEGRAWTTSGEGAAPLRAEALAELAQLRSGAVLVHVDRAEEARVAVETLRARGLAPTLVGLRQIAGPDEARAVAALGVPCVVTELGPEDSLATLAVPAELRAAGATVALASGAPAQSPRTLRLALALAVANGLPAADAVPAVTSHAAAALGASKGLGRVAVGARADLLVFDGAPWEPASRLLLTVTGGHVAFDAARKDAQ